MAHDSTRALFMRALHPDTKEAEANEAIQQWLRRVREDGEPIMYLTRTDAEELQRRMRATAAPPDPLAGAFAAFGSAFGAAAGERAGERAADWLSELLAEEGRGGRRR